MALSPAATPLSITYEAEGKRRTVLAPPDGLEIGSAPECDVVINEPTVEAHHVHLFFQWGTWWAEPLSAMAVFSLGRKRVRDVVQLRPGDVMRVGPAKLTLEFARSFEDTHSDEGEETWSSLDLNVQPEDLAERQRIWLLHQIRRASSSQSPTAFLSGVVPAILGCFSQASSATVLAHRDNELLPVANHPAGTPVVSFTLARRAARARQALAWERHVVMGESQRAPSLSDVTSALYCPILAEDGRLLGMLALTCTSLEAKLSSADLPAAIEVAKLLAPALQDPLRVMRTAGSTFLSYSHRDRQAALDLAGFLRRNHVSVWMDDRIDIGSDWRQALADAIRACDTFTLLISEESLRSKIVRWERRQASLSRKMLLPVLLSGGEGLPTALREVQYIDLALGEESRHRLADRIRVLSA